MPRLYIFESIEETIAFEHAMKPESRKPAGDPVTKVVGGNLEEKPEESMDEVEERPKPRKLIEYPAAKKCGYCHKTTHRGKDCPDKPTPGKKKSARTVTCKSCGKPGHLAKTCPKNTSPVPTQGEPQARVLMNADEIREKVTEMQNEGFTSLQIASRLRISLKQVNKYWNGEGEKLAAPEEDEEEGI